MLNSQVPLVTAAHGSSGNRQNRGHPFSRSYRANLPSSLARGHPSRLGLLTQEHLCRFSVRSWGLVPHPPFHGPQESGGPGSRPGYSRLQPVLAITALPGLQRLSGVFPRPPYPEASEVGPALPQTYPHGTGILTRFPFGGYQLGPTLGPANPWLIVVAMEPWSFPAEGVPTPLRCYYHRDLHRPRVHRTSRPGFCPMAAPPYPTRTNGPRAGVSAAGLSP